MLFATVNGRPVGTRFEAPAGSFEARVEFEVLGRDPLEKAEIVVGGEVAASFAPEADNPRRIAARHDLRIGRSTWIALRAFEPVRNSVVRFAHTSPFYVTIGNARPRDPDAARFYVRWIDELIDATEKKQAAAGNPAPFDSVLAAYRRARAVYQAAATSAEGVLPGASADAEAAWARISAFFRPPAELADDLGAYRSPLLLDDGRRAETPADWQKRREEILRCWHGQMGPWPPLVEKPRLEELETTAREGFTQKKVRLAAATDLAIEGYLLVPPGDAPRPAVLVVYYDAESGAGLNPKSPLRDFGYALTKRGFVSLSIGWPREYTDARGPRLQPLSCLAYIAANCWGAMAARPEVDGRRIGVVGHSFGGKWALFAGALWQKFACVAVSDPGIVFDEARANVNYWEPWYLGAEEGVKRGRGLVTAQNPRTGAYKRLMEAGRDLHELHALIAPRPLLVSGGAEDSPSRWKALNHAVAVNRMLGQENRVAMTNRQGHSPTEESNEQLYLFFEYFLKRPQAPAPAGK
ncbi:MAG: hypothetical protein FJ288_17760 [Planctomycetes bacterium]|nr:hypothetical protein [Planctomycetota bacterium]